MSDTRAPDLSSRGSLADRAGADARGADGAGIPPFPGDFRGFQQPSSGHCPPDDFRFGTPAPTAGRNLLVTGRYTGGDALADLVLRIDTDPPGTVSGDLFRRGEANRTWTVSFRSALGASLIEGTPIPLIAEDRYGSRSQGSITLAGHGGILTAQIVFQERLDGMPFNRPITMALAQESAGLRALGLEIETEQGVDPPPGAIIDGQSYSLESIFAAAGFDLEEAGRADMVPPAPEEGWSEKQLDILMHDLAQSDLTRPGFALRMLWLSRSNRPGLLGVMFDYQDDLPRR